MEEPWGPRSVGHLQQGEVRDWRGGGQEGVLIQSQQCPRRHPSSPPPGPGSQAPSARLSGKERRAAISSSRASRVREGRAASEAASPSRASSCKGPLLSPPGAREAGGAVPAVRKHLQVEGLLPEQDVSLNPRARPWVPATWWSACLSVEAEGQGQVSGVDLESTA